MRSGLTAAGLAVLALGCCAALPLVAAAGLSAAFALIGGFAVGALVLVAGIVAVVLRVRSTRRAACSARFRSKEV